KDLIETPTTPNAGQVDFGLFAQPKQIEVKVTLAEAPNLAALPAATRQKTTFEAKTGTLVFTGELDDADRAALKAVVQEAASVDRLERAFEQVDVALGKRPPTPAERGEPFRVPRLVLPGIGGEQAELFGE